MGDTHLPESDGHSIEECGWGRDFRKLKFLEFLAPSTLPNVRIPDQACHPFHANSATDSTAKLPAHQHIWEHPAEPTIAG